MIVDTASDVEAKICGDLKPEQVTANQFEFQGDFWRIVREAYGDEAVDQATQWVRDYLVEQDTAHETRCKEALQP